MIPLKRMQRFITNLDKHHYQNGLGRIPTLSSYSFFIRGSCQLENADKK
jgi:hypothetical protein